MMPAAHKREYHNAFPGGYVDHVLRVVECALKLNDVWVEMGVDTSTYTKEELVFSALNHDLGKIGDEEIEPKYNFLIPLSRRKPSRTHKISPFVEKPKGFFLFPCN